MPEIDSVLHRLLNVVEQVHPLRAAAFGAFTGPLLVRLLFGAADWLSLGLAVGSGAILCYLVADAGRSAALKAREETEQAFRWADWITRTWQRHLLYSVRQVVITKAALTQAVPTISLEVAADSHLPEWVHPLHFDGDVLIGGIKAHHINTTPKPGGIYGGTLITFSVNVELPKEAVDRLFEASDKGEEVRLSLSFDITWDVFGEPKIARRIELSTMVAPKL